MSYGEPHIAYLPLLHASSAGLFVNGRTLTPHALKVLDDESRIVATTMRVYSMVIEYAMHVAPAVGRRWSFWRSLAYNPHCVVISRSLERLYHQPPHRLPLSATPHAVASLPSQGVVRVLQDGFMARIMASARYARFDASSSLTPITAARLYRHAASIESDWRSLVQLDPLASLAAVEHGDVGQGYLDAHLGTAWRIRFTHAPKLRPGPVYVRFDEHHAGEAKLNELSADARGLWATVTVPSSRTERPGSHAATTSALFAHAYQHRALVWISDRTYVSSINLDQLGPWDGAAALPRLSPLVRKDVR